MMRETSFPTLAPCSWRDSGPWFEKEKKRRGSQQKAGGWQGVIERWDVQRAVVCWDRSSTTEEVPYCRFKTENGSSRKTKGWVSLLSFSCIVRNVGIGFCNTYCPRFWDQGLFPNERGVCSSFRVRSLFPSSGFVSQVTTNVVKLSVVAPVLRDSEAVVTVKCCTLTHSLCPWVRRSKASRVSFTQY